MNIALVTSPFDIYSNYNFYDGLNKEAIKQYQEKSNSFNFFDHDNLFLRKLHLLLYKKKIKINYYNNLKKFN